jgi:hypothetical protein
MPISQNFSISSFMKKIILALTLLALAAPTRSSAAVEKDIVGPTVLILTPGLGAVGLPQKAEKVVVSGTVTDNVQPAATGNTATASGISLIEYRFAGSKKWRSAIIVTGPTSTTGTTVSDWVFTFKLNKGSNKKVSVRGKDKEGNYGAVITFNVKRSRV